MTDGNFEEALAEFREILYTVPFIVLEKKTQEKELQDQVEVCREYIAAIRVELARREAKEPKRQCELSAYFTRHKLQPLHILLGLKGKTRTNVSLLPVLLIVTGPCC